MKKKRVPRRIVTDALREIRNTRSRFLSLFLLSALAVAFLAGLRTTAPAMQHTADGYYDRTHLMDVRVLSTLGLTDEDIAALAAAPGIEKAEGAWYVDATVHADQNDFIVRFHSLSEAGINDPELLEGRLPQNAGECVVEPALLSEVDLAIGDTLVLDTAGTDYEDALHASSYTIVGTVNSSLYLSRDRGSSTIGTGRLSAVAFLPRAAYDLDYYTEAYLLAQGAAELMCYDNAYKDKMDALVDQLEPLGEERAALRYEEVVEDANEALADAQKEFDDAEAEVREKLRDAEQELADARKELDDGWAEYNDGKATLAKETADAEREIADAERELPDALQKLTDGEADYAEGLQTWQDGKQEYDDGVQKLQDGEAEYQENLQKLQDAELEYRDGYAEYVDGLDQLQEGAAELSDAREQLASASAQLDAGAAELARGRQQLEAAQGQYDALKAGYEALGAAFGTPQGIQATVAGAAAGDPTALGTILTLRGTLVQLQSQLDSESTEYQQFAFLLQNFPADGAALAATAADPAGAPALAALLGQSYGAVGMSVAAMEQQLAAAQAQLASAEEQLAAGRRQYNQGRREYNEALQRFNDSVIELQDAKKTLDDARAELDDGWAQLADGRAELDEARVTLDDALQELTDGEAELRDARKELDDGWAEYRDGLKKLADAKEELPREVAKAEAELADTYEKLTDGEAEYADGVQDYEEGKAEAEQELSDARRELNDARRKLAEIEDCKWYILSRSTNAGYVSYQQDAERMGNLASVFPLIFFLVAALVCLTTMTRMVEEQRVQIGGLKALGYSRRAIALKYVGYGFLASFGGGIVGLLVGCTLIPTIIFNAWKVMYTTGDLTTIFFPDICLFALCAAVLCVTGTALASSFAALTAVPAALMRPKAPTPGKRVLLERITFLWKRLSFTRKVSFRNLFRYKKRFWMAVIGIGGCTALLITGFGLRDSIHGFFDTQYDELTTYHAQISLVDDVTDDELTEIARELDGNALVENWTTVSSFNITAESAKRSMDSYVYLFAVTDESKFGEFVHLRDRKTGEPVPLSSDGAVVSEKLADMLGVKVGDTITLVDADQDRVSVPITGIIENYVFHYVYLSHEAYLSIYGHQPTVNSVMVRYTEDTQENSDAVSSALIPLSGVSSVSRTQTLREQVARGLEGVDYAVIIVVISAAALAFVVLYNLTNINITERLRELATLKVLGFYDRETSAYVSRENVFLTVFGVLLGLVMGKFLHQWLVLTVEIDMAMFGREAKPLSYVLAVVFTFLFSFLVNLAARRRLRKIDMVESLKTVE